MRITKFLLVLTTLAFFSFKTASNHPGEWKFIEDKKVGFDIDHDVILVGNVNDDFRQIKLRVTDGPLEMYNMKVYFDNGGVQEIALRQRFAQGSESRAIDLDGGLRHLAKIEFWYETKGFLRGRSRIAVWGRK
jgi:hypothetical protein